MSNILLSKKLKELQSTYLSISPQYLSIHQMFGPSITDVNGQTILITHQQNCETNTLLFFKHIFEAQGAIVYEIDYERHDKIMAIIQGLNHFNVFISAKTLSLTFEDLELIKKLSSPTYRIFLIFYTRYVLQSPKLYAEIQIFNPYIKEIISLFMEESKKFLSLIEEKNFHGFEAYIHSMQPFFEKNREDSHVSDILIKELGSILSMQKIKKTSFSIEKKIQQIKFLILDVDATMTDGGIYITDEGIIFKKFHVKDGVGIKNLMEYGIEVGFISHSHSSNIVKTRAEILGIERWYSGKEPKEVILAHWLKEMNISFEEVGMVGDDINDISLMEKVGFVACPADAIDSVKQISDIVLSLNGGDGCIRELIDIYIFPIHKQ